MQKLALFPRLFPRLAAGLLATATLAAAPLAQAADTVSVQLDWVVRANHAMFFVAKDKGYFKDADIDVTAIRKGTGSTDALRLVARGNAQFGFADLPTLQVARSQNVPAVALVAVNQHSPLAVISVKAKKPLTKPSDLKGLNFGVHPSGSTYIFLRAFLAANGMRIDDMMQSTVSPPYESYLVMGRVDAVPGYIDAEVPELESKTGGPGSLSILQGSDFGYQAYGSGMFTSEDLIKQNPGLVQRFTAAYLKAFQFVIDNPKEAVDIVVKMNPEYKGREEMLAKQLDADIKHTFFSDYTKANGIGAISPEQWKQTADTLKEQDVLPKTFDVSTGFDPKFVQAGNPVRR